MSDVIDDVLQAMRDLGPVPREAKVAIVRCHPSLTRAIMEATEPYPVAWPLLPGSIQLESDALMSEGEVEFLDRNRKVMARGDGNKMHWVWAV